MSYNVKDIPANEFIHKLAEKLKKDNKIQIPEWTEYVTTACFKTLPPQDQDWVYIRIAALARKVFIRGHIGVGTLKHIFGGSQRRGHRQPHHRQASGKLIRWSLQQLEKLEIVQKDSQSLLKKDSRVISSKGQRLLNSIATEIIKQKQK